MLKGLGNLEDEILSSLFGVISSKREDMENKWKNTQKLKKIKTCVQQRLFLSYKFRVKMGYKFLLSLLFHKYKAVIVS